MYLKIVNDRYAPWVLCTGLAGSGPPRLECAHGARNGRIHIFNGRSRVKMKYRLTNIGNHRNMTVTLFAGFVTGK
jgi:hypothetical protein